MIESTTENINYVLVDFNDFFRKKSITWEDKENKNPSNEDVIDCFKKNNQLFFNQKINLQLEKSNDHI